MELTAANNWTTTVNGLDRETLLAGGYTLEEELAFGFMAEVSDLQVTSIDQWKGPVSLSSLTTGKVYAFVFNGKALADNGTYKRINNVNTRVLGLTNFNDTPTKEQQWMVVETSISGSTTQVLKNVATGNYLKESEQNMLMVPNADGGCKFLLVNSRIRMWPQSDGSGWHIRVNNNNLDMSWELANGTQFTFYERDYREEYKITVTNTYGSFIMPSTGGMGTAPYYTFGILLILAAALMYLLKAVCRRQKGGR